LGRRGRPRRVSLSEERRNGNVRTVEAHEYCWHARWWGYSVDVSRTVSSTHVRAPDVLGALVFLGTPSRALTGPVAELFWSCFAGGVQYQPRLIAGAFVFPGTYLLNYTIRGPRFFPIDGIRACASPASRRSPVRRAEAGMLQGILTVLHPEWGENALSRWCCCTWVWGPSTP